MSPIYWVLLPVFNFMKLLNIIIADDHPIYRDGLEQAVRRLKVADRIYQASNGLEVIEIFQANPVDLIFMDVRMPQLSGFDTTNHLRVIDQEVKIIIVSMLEDKNQKDGLDEMLVSVNASKLIGDKDKKTNDEVKDDPSNSNQ